MPDSKNIAGVVLAGGRSSRMGRDKALLDYKGRPLLDYMIGLLEQAGLSDIYVSGDLEGYRCIPDSAPHEGPARAIVDVLTALEEYDGVLFVPVDMPRLTPDILKTLLIQPQGAYYATHPFPFYIVQYRGRKAMCGGGAVKGFLQAENVQPIPLPPEFEPCMINTNTPEEWQEALRA